VNIFAHNLVQDGTRGRLRATTARWLSACNVVKSVAMTTASYYQLIRLEIMTYHTAKLDTQF